MVRVKHCSATGQWEKEFLKVFDRLAYTRSAWQVWADLMSVMACSISNAVDRSKEHFEKRGKEYGECIKRLGNEEVAAQIFHIVTMALENNPEQDFLGKMYMNLELGNHWKGQFFTPYNVCKMMSEMMCGDIEEQIEEKGYVAVCDPACGAGATLIATANKMKKIKYNFQNHVLFVGQDIDRITGMMCYIQLSLLGCPGYVLIADTLSNPMTGHVLFPQEKEGQELWYTPVFQLDVWQWRRLFKYLGSMCGTVTTEKTVEKEHFYMFFDFEEKEKRNGGKQEIGAND